MNQNDLRKRNLVSERYFEILSGKNTLKELIEDLVLKFKPN